MLSFFPVEDIKNKFKNLRTTFQRQYKMVKASKVCGADDVFVPQWKHYQQLLFLCQSWDKFPMLVNHTKKATDFTCVRRLFHVSYSFCLVRVWLHTLSRQDVAKELVFVSAQLTRCLV